MISERVSEVLRRVDAIWPPRKDVPAAERQEWVRFLSPLDAENALDAIDALKETMKFRPSMADFKSAYTYSATMHEEKPELSGAQNTDLFDLYGSSMDDWVYCFRCDMAITLEERSTEPYYSPGHGLHHKRCPRRGSAPVMPVWMKLQREEKMRSKQ